MNKNSNCVLGQDRDASKSLMETLSEFNKFGSNTIMETRQGIPYFVNEFWTSAQRQSHSIHEVSYRACFKAQLPEFFINRLTQPGDVVFDPFMGRGTTPIQAALMERQAYGNDINPLAAMLARPRMKPITVEELDAALKTVDWERGEIIRHDLLAFYHPTTLRKLESLRLWISERAPIGSNHPDHVTDWIRMVAINRLSGHSPGFFSGRSMPPNQAVSLKSQNRINDKLGLLPPERDIGGIILKKSRTLLKDGCAPSQASINLHTGPAWDIPDIKDATVDLTVTSPPFLDIVQYASDNWLRCWFAGINTGEIAFDMHRNEHSWTNMIQRVLAEQARILRPRGYVALEVGEVRNGTVLLEELVWKAAEDQGFERLGVMVNQQNFSKTANCWGVDNGSKGTNTNRIILLRRNTQSNGGIFHPCASSS